MMFILGLLDFLLVLIALFC